MEEVPDLLLSVFSALEINFFSSEVLVSFFIILILIVLSAFISGAEVAFFSLTSVDIEEIKKNKSHLKVLDLLKEPNKLLATILIANNFINVSIVILFAYLTSIVITFPEGSNLEFIFEVIIITSLLVLFGEITPKVYANKNAKRFSLMMAIPLKILHKIFYPLSYMLVSTTNFIDKRLAQRKKEVSIEDLSKALDLTEQESKEQERKILRSIVEFGDTDVKEIMRSRVDVLAIKDDTPLSDVIHKIVQSGFSRIPIYKGQLDNIIGILYIKDLIPYLNETNDFNWISLCRSAYYVPETKMINSLLKEFQVKKNHIAIVVDEYGGMSGIVTLEDVLEEIVGEINDEFDSDENIYSKLDDFNYVFEGKISLIDFLKIVNGESNYFDQIKGEADSLAGLIVEVEGRILKIGEECKIPPYSMIVESADNKRIKRLKVTIDEK